MVLGGPSPLTCVQSFMHTCTRTFTREGQRLRCRGTDAGEPASEGERRLRELGLAGGPELGRPELGKTPCNTDAWNASEKKTELLASQRWPCSREGFG